jgi:hypothetical protein
MRPRQAADMRGLDAIGVLLELHGVFSRLRGAAIRAPSLDRSPCYVTVKRRSTGGALRMHRSWIEAALFFGLAIATAGAVSAQQRQPLPPAQPSIMDEDEDALPVSPQPAKPPRARGQQATPALEPDPDLDADDQLAPSQVKQPMPAAVATPTGGEKRTRAAARAMDGTAEPGAVARPARAGKQYVVACDGVFGKDSSQAKLAMAYQSRNVAFTQVDAAAGGKAMASVLFGKDPKRRLEVWWSKPATRTDTHLIVINGQSDWIAPGELHLGLTLAELEQLNGKPFKLLGFNKDNVATLSDWNAGKLSALPGDCKIGVSLRADPKAPASTLSAAPAERAFSSADAALRAANPTVSEILVAY